jgi:ATP-dependent protease HslVU (ClpYQ) peptidase subunit
MERAIVRTLLLVAAPMDSAEAEVEEVAIGAGRQMALLSNRVVADADVDAAEVMRRHLFRVYFTCFFFCIDAVGTLLDYVCQGRKEWT